MRTKMLLIVLTLAGAGWLFVPLSEARADGEPVLLAGSWEGEYIDITGFRGRLFVELEVEDDAVRGSYRLEVPDEESLQVYRGNCEGRLDGTNLELEVEIGKLRSTFSAQLADAMPFALQALSGSVKNPPGSSFKGGVFVLWRFAD